MMHLIRRSWRLTLILELIWLPSFTYDYGTCVAFEEHEFPHMTIREVHGSCVAISVAGPFAIPALALFSSLNANGWSIE